MARQGYDLQLTRNDEPGWRDLLHDGHGALGDEHDRHWLGADAVARGAQEDFAMIFSARAFPLNQRGDAAGRIAQLFGVSRG